MRTSVRDVQSISELKSDSLNGSMLFQLGSFIFITVRFNLNELERSSMEKVESSLQIIYLLIIRLA